MTYWQLYDHEVSFIAFVVPANIYEMRILWFHVVTCCDLIKHRSVSTKHPQSQQGYHSSRHDLASFLIIPFLSTLQSWYLSAFSSPGPHHTSEETRHAGAYSRALRIHRCLAIINSYMITRIVSAASRGKLQPWRGLRTQARPSGRALTSSWHNPWPRQ